MNAKGLLLVSGLFLLSAGDPTQAAAASFAIVATNVTMPQAVDATSQFTITNIPITGVIILNCGYSGSLAIGNLPICPLTPPHAYSVTAGGTLKGSITFYPPNVAVPAIVPAVGLGLAGLVVLGLGRGKGKRWMLLVPALFFGSIGFAGIAACGGKSGPVMPKGTFPYTITAVNSPAAGEGPSVETHTTILVTVQ